MREQEEAGEDNFVVSFSKDPKPNYRIADGTAGWQFIKYLPVTDTNFNPAGLPISDSP